jgi:hypothetical protein
MYMIVTHAGLLLQIVFNADCILHVFYCTYNYDFSGPCPLSSGRGQNHETCNCKCNIPVSEPFTIQTFCYGISHR